MNLTPIYTPENVQPVHNLRFDWTGWLNTPPADPMTVRKAIAACQKHWQDEGIEFNTAEIEGNAIQLLARISPRVSPLFFAQRIKGRLQHALRQTGADCGFRRKVAVRSLGDNVRGTVESYIDRQADKSDYIDPCYIQVLGQFAVAEAGVHLEEASGTAHGRYWYNLHLVIVIADRRYPVTRNENFRKLRKGCVAIADKKGCLISHLAIMPDHIHIALRGDVKASPEEIALGFLNNLSYFMGYNRCWSWEYYVGSFSEYDLRVIKRR